MEQFAFFADAAVEFDLLNGNDKQAIRRAASRAINTIARRSRTLAADTIISRINFPAGYVAPRKERLSVTGFSSPTTLEAEITARGRATSLARFVTSGRGYGKPGVSVSVGRGNSTFLRRAFLLPLKRGFGPDVDGPKNKGLAIRLRPGESFANRYSTRSLGGGLFLLYGPSVAQVFESNAGTGVKREIMPEIENDLTREFLRLLGLED